MMRELPRPLVRVRTDFNRREGFAVVLPDDAPAAVLVAGTRIMFYERDQTEWREGVAIVRPGEEFPWVADIVEGTIMDYPEYKGKSGNDESKDGERPSGRHVPRGMITILNDFNDVIGSADGTRSVPLAIEHTPPEALVPGTRVIVSYPGDLECEAIVKRGEDIPWVAEIIEETVHYFR
jgi:hypothetical protein